MGENKQTAGKLGVIGLACIVISSMVGGGVFSLPQNMAAGASAGAVLIAWLVTGIGMYFIANTFSILYGDFPCALYKKYRCGDYGRNYNGCAELFFPAVFRGRK